MGLLKKIFKPVSKVLDKIVPNEVKPFLPYAAAFAPFIAPGIMGTSVMQRALMGGGLNIFGQLAQEGNEGDINLLSAGLGALSGAMSAPGTQASPIGDGAQFVDTGAEAFKYSAAGQPSGAQFFKGLSDSAEGQTGVMASGQRFLGDTLAKGSDIMSAGLKEGLFSKAGLKAAALPGATATGDLMFAQAKRDQDEYDRMMEEESESEYASDASRALAIRQSMESYGFTEEEILAAIEAAGYKAGGRVGFTKGGDVMKAVERGIDPAEALDLLEEFKKMKEKYGYEMSFDNYLDGEVFAKGGRVGFDSGGGLMDTVVGMFKKEDKGPDFGGITEAVKNIEEKPKEVLVDKLKVTIEPGQSEMRAIIEAMYNDVDGVMPDDRKNQFYELYSPQMYRNGEMDKAEFEFIQTEILGKEIPKMAEGGLMNLGGKEMDMRGGGFIPIGKKERADDVPARLSKNEFVMTADAVRAAGGGSVNKGAKRMYDVMNKLEARA